MKRILTCAWIIDFFKKRHNCVSPNGEIKHKWKGRGSFGCHCRGCDITLKEFVERGGKV